MIFNYTILCLNLIDILIHSLKKIKNFPLLEPYTIILTFTLISKPMYKNFILKTPVYFS